MSKNKLYFNNWYISLKYEKDRRIDLHQLVTFKIKIVNNLMKARKVMKNKRCCSPKKFESLLTENKKRGPIASIFELSTRTDSVCYFPVFSEKIG